VRKFYVASAVKAVAADTDISATAPQQFRGSSAVTLSTQDPLMKAAMTYLGDIWPLPASFDTLLTKSRSRLTQADHTDAAEPDRLATRLLHCHAAGLVEFSISEPPFVASVSDRPVASPYARLRARQGGKVNNLRLEVIMLTDPSRLVLQHLDGEHDRTALVELILQWTEKSEATPPPAEPAATTPRQRAQKYVDQVLEAFAASALLVG
jgi:methyltransferase-like protein